LRISALILGAAVLAGALTAGAQTAPSASAAPDSFPALSDRLKHPIPPGGYEVLSDTQGVDFKFYLSQWHHITGATWQPLIPKEVNPPTSKSGMVVIRFKILPNGRLVSPDGMTLERRSGDTALDRAAWGAISGSDYPQLPKDFKGPFLEIRAYFLYNMKPPV
jgi:hypothetical protein